MGYCGGLFLQKSHDALHGLLSNSVTKNRTSPMFGGRFVLSKFEMCITGNRILYFSAKYITPNSPKPGFCIFRKFGQAIVIRVLMLNF